jgi:hypothetical protein
MRWHFRIDKRKWLDVILRGTGCGHWVWERAF